MELDVSAEETVESSEEGWMSDGEMARWNDDGLAGSRLTHPHGGAK
jgi:hypothetical protein